MPIDEYSLRVLQKVSRYYIAVLAACLVGNFILLTNSVFSVETKRSAFGALSRALPALPIDEVMTPYINFSPKESAVYWVLWPERWTKLGAGFLLSTAISRASITVSVLR